MQQHNVNIDTLLKGRGTARIEFWRDNGDNTCTRLSDNLTLTVEEYEHLPGKQQELIAHGARVLQ